MIKTYVDANALIAAFGGNNPASEPSLIRLHITREEAIAA